MQCHRLHVRVSCVTFSSLVVKFVSVTLGDPTAQLIKAGVWTESNWLLWFLLLLYGFFRRSNILVERMNKTF